MSHDRMFIISGDVMLHEQARAVEARSKPRMYRKPGMYMRGMGGPGGQGEMHDPKAGANQWGQLPAKERDQILQAGNEGFPPGYEKVLAGYYQRLSQEKVTDDSSAEPTTRPGR